MKRSSERILTTHTGSLPRPADLVQMIVDRDGGAAINETAFAGRVRSAVAEAVTHQAGAGVDVVNDGEGSKISYATYVGERLNGMGGTGGPSTGIDVLDFPDYAEQFLADPNRRRRKYPTCIGPVSLRDPEAVQTDIANLKAGLKDVRVEEAFMTAASPGVIARFVENRYYPSHEAYIYALADAMKPEYEAIAAAGLVLQMDCPDLAMDRHYAFAEQSLEEFRSYAALHVEVLNYALAGIAPEQVRMHLCWGNYEGPHHRDVALKDVLDIVLRARPSGISIEAANPRHAHEWKLFEEVMLPDGKLLIPGVIDSSTNYIEHPELVAQRILNYTRLVGRENVLAGSDCGFGTFLGRTRVAPSIVWAKLAAMTEGAKLATQELW